MSRLKIAIFEDDQDLAEHFVDTLPSKVFEVKPFFSLDRDPKDDWFLYDVVLGDYRNQIVKFSQLATICDREKIALIAISGGDMKYEPQLQKPFTLEELQAKVLETLARRPNHRQPERGWLTRLLGKKTA